MLNEHWLSGVKGDIRIYTIHMYHLYQVYNIYIYENEIYIV